MEPDVKSMKRSEWIMLISRGLSSIDGRVFNLVRMK